MKIHKITWMHIRRSPYQAIAAILTMFITFLLIGTFFLMTVSSIQALKFFESKPQITVFFIDKATKDEIQTLQNTLTATGKIANIKYVSKEDALAIYKEQNKNDPLLLEMVTADILPASLEVSTTDPKFLRELEPVIKKSSGVEEIVYQRDVVDTLLSWTYAIRVIGGIVVGLMVIDTILIIMTVIAMKIALRKEEIGILSLVGASPWYVRLPFVLEGGFYGVVGSLFSWAVITGLILWFRPFLLASLGTIPSIYTVLSNPLASPFLLTFFGFLTLQLVSGFLLGSIGSLVALSRYLKF